MTPKWPPSFLRNAAATVTLLMTLAAAALTTPAVAQVDTTARGMAILAKQATATRQPRLSIISGAEQWYGLGTTMNTGVFNTVRVKHVNLASCVATGLRLVAANYGQAITTSDGLPAGPKERQNPNPITIHSAFEFNGTKTDQTGARIPVRWSGQPTLTMSPSGALYASPSEIVSDATPSFVLPGQTFYERSAVTVPANGNQYFTTLSLRGGTTGYGTDSGEGYFVNSVSERAFDGVDVTIAAPQFSTGWSGMMVLGTCADGTVAPSIMIAGDSIVTQVDDAAYGYYTGGWALRAFANYPHFMASLPGEMELAAVSYKNWATKYDASQYSTHVLWAYGRNDLSYYMGTQGLSAAATFANMKATRLQAAKLFMMPRGNGAPGQVFIGTTILPAPTSSDGFAVLANESKDVYEAGRVLFNDWMRDTSASGFVAQANAQVAGVSNAGVARVADPCIGLEVNSSGAFALDGGYSPVYTTVYGTGTSSGSNSANIFNDTTKTWTANAFKGAEIQITGGTGVGQYRSVGFNTATSLTISNAWTTLPDATSTYKITDAPGWNGVHPGTRGAILSAGSLPVAGLMRPLPAQ